MAQSVEQLICNLQVMGSSPFTSSKKKQKALTENSVRAFLLWACICMGTVGWKDACSCTWRVASCSQTQKSPAWSIPYRACLAGVSLRRYWQQFARVLAAERQKARRDFSRLFSLAWLPFGVWQNRHTQALDPVRFQEADVTILAQHDLSCPVQIGPQVCSTLAALEVGRYQQFMVDLAVQLEKRALVESQVEE